MTIEKAIESLEKITTVHHNGGMTLGIGMIDSIEYAIDQLKAIKAQEPRVLTAEEIRDMPDGSVVWEEYMIDGAAYRDLEPQLKRDNALVDRYGEGPIMEAEPNRYGERYRYWSGKASEKQRRETAWG